jgi:biopolymer transport protein ExbD
MRRRRQSSYEEDDVDDTPIDIIPLIDVIFLLLCFFIFLSLAMVVQEGVDVNLAQAESGESVQDREPLVISINDQGELFLRERSVDEDELLAKLKAEAEQNSDRPVFINADKETRHRRVMLALDTVRRAGLSNVTFTVEPQ